jgi:hypothetical protein
MKSLLTKTSHIIALVALFFLTACSDAEQTSQNNTTSTPSSETGRASQPLQLDLLTVPLNKQEFLGLTEPAVKVAAPCPFLSDEAATAVVKSSWELKRRETSNEQCYWSKNLGFSVKLTIEPLATAKPVAERAYNLDSPPILKSQVEPGNNATVLYDTVWDKERPYAISFELDNKLVMIFVTGMSTDAELLTTAAKEVAAKLPTESIAASIQDEPVEFDMCSIWHESQMAALIGSPINVTKGKLDCTWASGLGDSLKQINVMVSYGKGHTWDYLLELGGVAVPGIGESAMLNKMRKKPNRPGHVTLKALYDERLVNFTVTESIVDNEAVAIALSKNIDSRFR